MSISHIAVSANMKSLGKVPALQARCGSNSLAGGLLSNSVSTVIKISIIVERKWLMWSKSGIFSWLGQDWKYYVGLEEERVLVERCM